MEPGITHQVKQLYEVEKHPMEVAHELFRPLTENSKAVFLSAVREANGLKVYKVKYLQSLLLPRQGRPEQPVHPQNPQLLSITYPGRSLKDYDNLI